MACRRRADRWPRIWVKWMSIDAVRSEATQISRGWSKPGAPASWALTAAMFGALARDDDLLTVAAAIPEDKLPALLFCASACYLIADREPDGLVDYFPKAGAPQPVVDAAFEPALRAFCLDYRDELVAVGGRRRYQMNEVARTTQVALALDMIGRRYPGAKIALIDLGSGAGLLLHLDRYCHELSAGRKFGDPHSELTLRCESTGPLPPPSPFAPPSIVSRIGVDLEPIDLTDADDRRWARACIPPETKSLERFDRAARLVAAYASPIRRGDAIEVLPAILDTVPEDVLPVVTDTYTAVFFSDEQRGQLGEVLAQRSAIGDIAWISLDPLVPLGTEGRHSVQGLDVPHALVTEYQRGGVFALLGLLYVERGRRHGGLLARAHPSGTSMSWLDEATSETTAM